MPHEHRIPPPDSFEIPGQSVVIQGAQRERRGARNRIGMRHNGRRIIAAEFHERALVVSDRGRQRFQAGIDDFVDSLGGWLRNAAERSAISLVEALSRFKLHTQAIPVFGILIGRACSALQHCNGDVAARFESCRGTFCRRVMTFLDRDQHIVKATVEKTQFGCPCPIIARSCKDFVKDVRGFRRIPSSYPTPGRPFTTGCEPRVSDRLRLRLLTHTPVLPCEFARLPVSRSLLSQKARLADAPQSNSITLKSPIRIDHPPSELLRLHGQATSPLAPFTLESPNR